jgi:hypothetical protein
LKNARAIGSAEIEFTYESASRAIAVMDRHVRSVRVDGIAQPVQPADPNSVLLPCGQHIVTIATD